MPDPRSARIVSAIAPVVAGLALLAVAGAAAPAANAAGANRTWVSGVGDDANPCSRTAPCKTFAGAISKTHTGGEINAIDSGGFGTVTITKSITIDGSGVLAGVANAATHGIIISAPATADITIRGLTIHGGEPDPTTAPCAPRGLTGIRILGAGTVRIENTTISNQIQGGIMVQPSASAPGVIVDNAAVRTSCGPGIDVAPTGAGTADLTVRNSVVSNTTVGLRVNSGGRAWLSGSTITSNVLGLQTLGTGTIASYFNSNQIHGNGTDGTPTTTIGGPVPGPAGTVGPAGPVGPAAPSSATTSGTGTATTAGTAKTQQNETDASCRVPKLTGATRSVATKRLTKAGCRVGKVTRKPTTGKKVGRVLSQGKKAGTSVPEGTKVNLTVGRKR